MRTRSVSQGRRDFLRRSGAVLSTFLLLALGNANYRRAGAASVTPACMDDHEPTLQQTAGPFFQPHSPQRASLLEPGINGTKIVLTGRVLSTRCRAMSGALLDFWHANDAGEYDVEGFRLRGHQFADSEGHYRLETIVPGLSGTHTTLPCDGAAAERADSHHPTVLSRGAAQRSRLPLRSPATDDDRRRRRAKGGPVRFRARVHVAQVSMKP
ncbi:MAG: hypothetical protein QOI13_1306 [Paraburkholderia sp.]|nr:hypothetical protein [Paraburkholderia sp.]